MQVQDLSPVQLENLIATTWTLVHKPDGDTRDIVMVEGEGGAVSVPEWNSNKMKIPATSPLAGEAEAAIKVHGRIAHHRHILQELFGIEVPGVIVTDSKSLKEAVHSNNCIKDKRTSIAVAELRAVCEEDRISMD